MDGHRGHRASAPNDRTTCAAPVWSRLATLLYGSAMAVLYGSAMAVFFMGSAVTSLQAIPLIIMCPLIVLARAVPAVADRREGTADEAVQRATFIALLSPRNRSDGTCQSAGRRVHRHARRANTGGLGAAAPLVSGPRRQHKQPRRHRLPRAIAFLSPGRLDVFPFTPSSTSAVTSASCPCFLQVDPSVLRPLHGLNRFPAFGG
jgi:hypothetical protein